MRTTIEIADEVFRLAKRRAADEGVPLRHVVEAALRAFLTRRPAKGKRYALRWHTEAGRLQPGVRIEDRDSLFDVMGDR
jgi:hypothetical protein